MDSIDYYLQIKIIDNHHFVIQDTKRKNATNNAIETLKKIEFVLENRLQLSSLNHSNHYQALTVDELQQELCQRAKEIKDRYLAKTASFSFVRRFFGRIDSKNQKIVHICHEIESHWDPLKREKTITEAKAIRAMMEGTAASEADITYEEAKKYVNMITKRVRWFSNVLNLRLQNKSTEINLSYLSRLSEDHKVRCAYDFSDLFIHSKSSWMSDKSLLVIYHWFVQTLSSKSESWKEDQLFKLLNNLIRNRSHQETITKDTQESILYLIEVCHLSKRQLPIEFYEILWLKELFQSSVFIQREVNEGRFDNVEIIKILLEKDIPIDKISLLKKAIGNNQQLVNFILSIVKRPNLKYAIEKANLDCIKLFIESGSVVKDVNKLMKYLPPETNENRSQIQKIKLFFGNPLNETDVWNAKLMKHYLLRNISLDYSHVFQGACQARDFYCVKTLIKRNVLSLTEINDALYYAFFPTPSWDLIKILLAAGATINHEFSDGKTLLDYPAAQGKNSELMTEF